MEGGRDGGRDGGGKVKSNQEIRKGKNVQLYTFLLASWLLVPTVAESVSYSQTSLCESQKRIGFGEI